MTDDEGPTFEQAEKELGAVPVNGEQGEADVASGTDGKERPTVERFYTAAPGAGLLSSGAKPDEVEGVEKIDRPPVERFETAQEDLSTLAKSKEKA